MPWISLIFIWIFKETAVGDQTTGKGVIMAMPSFIKATQEFFSKPPYGRRVAIDEFKALTDQDKVELSAMLQQTPGFEHVPYVSKQ
jgi:hypothetical protein